MRVIVLATLAVTTLFGVSSAAAPSPLDQPLYANHHAYLFTQQQRDNLYWWNGTWIPQTVPDGAYIEVQLASDPIRWVPDLGPSCRPSPIANLVPTSILPLRSQVSLLATSTLPDEGRITGTSTISVFDYQVRGIGIAALCLHPDPVPADPQVLGFPPGTARDYVVTFVVGVPQLSVP